MAEKTIDHERPAEAAATTSMSKPAPGSLDKRGRRGWLLRRNQAPAPVVQLRRIESTVVDSGDKPPVGLITLLAFVLAPFIASLIYYQAIASSQYISETRFAVRSLSDLQTKEPATGTPVRGILSLNPLSQDAYVVTSFVHSQEIIERLSRKTDMRAFFLSEDIDPLSRLDTDATEEEFLDYWSKHVWTFVDGPSGITTLYVRAFSPQDAQTIAKLITAESETLVNELSSRARTDIVARAAKEVQEREVSYRKTLDELNSLQNASGVLSPGARASETGQLLTGLMAAKLDIDSRLFVLRRSVGDSSPNVVQLESTQRSLGNQIDELRGQLAATATVNDNLSNTLNRFANLETNRTIAEGLYAAARRNLENAQFEAIRKAVYVNIFVTSTLPEESRYPERWSTPILTLLGLFMAWAVLALAWASIQDHRF